MNQAFCKKIKKIKKQNKTKQKCNKKVKLSLSVSAFFGGDVDPGMTLQRKLKPFFCIPFHSPEVQHPIEKSRAKKLSHQSNQGSSESLCTKKKIPELLAP